MAYVREPEGVDFIVAPTVLTASDRAEISAFIANYKKSEATISVLAEPEENIKRAKSRNKKKATDDSAQKERKY